MATPAHAIFIHGVGTQHQGFSDAAQKHLAAGLYPGRVLYGQEALWAPLLDREEDVMMRDVGRRGSKNHPLQRLVLETLADALAFPNRQAEIFQVLDSAYCKLRTTEPVIIVAHSLGVLLALEWLRSRSVVRVERFVAIGANVSLWSIGDRHAYVCPKQVANRGKFINCFDPEDMLGYPLAGWQPHVIDVEVSVGGWLGWTGLAHIGYWGDTKLFRRTLPALLG